MNMVELPIDDMIENRTTRYALVVGVAKRARQIVDDYENDDLDAKENPVLAAIDDFKNHRYSILGPDYDD